LRIEDYFQQIRSAIDACPLIRSSRITYDKRSTYSGLIRGELHFPDGSVLFLREFVDVEIFEERLTYAYQYMDSGTKLVFRYDNTGHHKKLNVSSYPHHKHLGNGEVVYGRLKQLFPGNQDGLVGDFEVATSGGLWVDIRVLTRPQVGDFQVAIRAGAIGSLWLICRSADNVLQAALEKGWTSFSRRSCKISIATSIS